MESRQFTDQTPQQWRPLAVILPSEEFIRGDIAVGEFVHRQDSPPTRILKTVHRQN